MTKTFTLTVTEDQLKMLDTAIQNGLIYRDAVGLIKEFTSQVSAQVAPPTPLQVNDPQPTPAAVSLDIQPSATAAQGAT